MKKTENKFPTRNYVTNLIVCILLLSCGPHKEVGPQGNTSNTYINPDNSLSPYEIHFLDNTPPNQSYSDLIHHFDQALARKEGQKEIVTFTRNIAARADANGLNHDGFSWEIKKLDGVMKVLMQGEPSNKPGYLDKDYEQENGKQHFGKYIEEATQQEKTSAIFRSTSKNILAIPIGKYLTVYHFSKNAEEEEIISFWQDIVTSVKHFSSEKVEHISIHTGEKYLQTVAHFHLRIQIKKEYHQEVAEQYDYK